MEPNWTRLNSNISDFNMMTSFVKPSFETTVASGILTSIPDITATFVLFIEQFGLFDPQKHTWIGSDDTTDSPLCW